MSKMNEPISGNKNNSIKITLRDKSVDVSLNLVRKDSFAVFSKLAGHSKMHQAADASVRIYYDKSSRTYGYDHGIVINGVTGVHNILYPDFVGSTNSRKQWRTGLLKAAAEYNTFYNGGQNDPRDIEKKRFV